MSCVPVEVIKFSKERIKASRLKIKQGSFLFRTKTGNQNVYFKEYTGTGCGLLGSISGMFNTFISPKREPLKNTSVFRLISNQSDLKQVQ